MKSIKFIFIIILFIALLNASEITFTYENAILTGMAPNYSLEFDVMAHADEEGIRLGDNMLYINYDTTGFGRSIVNNGGLSVEKGTLLLGGSAPFYYYTILPLADNTNSKFAATAEYNYPDYPEYGNIIPTTPTQLLHIKMDVVDSTVWSGISFDSLLMSGQQYYSTNNPEDIFDIVTASDSLNVPLQYYPSAINPDFSKNFPSDYKLFQNYPNPFNPNTSFTVEIPWHSESIDIEIYNIIGQKIATIFSGTIEAGTHKFNWNSKNSAGQVLPSGIYFTVLKSGSVQRMMKMTLLK